MFDNGVFEVYTLDTGQSDATFIIAPDGSTHLIDADKTDVADELNGVLEERTSGADAPDFEDAKHLDTAAATHIHRDHVKGMDKLAEEGYETDRLIEPDPDRYETRGKGQEGPGAEKQVVNDYQSAAERMGAGSQEDLKTVVAGDEVGGTFEVLGPPDAGDEAVKEKSPKTGHTRTLKPRSANANGVVLKTATEDGRSELFTGDLEDTSGDNGESWLMAQHEKGEINLDADVLHVGHHGSASATSTELLERVDPDLAVMSSDTINSYGHPADEMLKRLHEHGVAVRWTALDGTVRTHEEKFLQGSRGLLEDGPHSAADVAVMKKYAGENNLTRSELREKAIRLEQPVGLGISELPRDLDDWMIENASVINEKVQRQKEIADILGEIDTKEMTAFYETTPEFEVFPDLLQKYDEDLVYLLGVCGGAFNYHFRGEMNSQKYYQEIAEAVSHNGLQEPDDVREIMKYVIRETARDHASDRIDRLDKIFESGFAEWFVDNHLENSGDDIWTKFTNALGGKSNQKTISFAMKVYDIVHLNDWGDHAEFERDVPIPVDFHVRTISKNLGLTPELPDPANSPEYELQLHNKTIRTRWQQILKHTNQKTEADINMFELDNIIWQLGQKLYCAEPDRENEMAKQHLTQNVGYGLREEVADELVEELCKHGDYNFEGENKATSIRSVKTDGDWINNMYVEVTDTYESDLPRGIQQKGTIDDGSDSCRFEISKGSDQVLNKGEVYHLENILTKSKNGEYIIKIIRRSNISKTDLEPEDCW